MFTSISNYRDLSHFNCSSSKLFHFGIFPLRFFWQMGHAYHVDVATECITHVRPRMNTDDVSSVLWAGFWNAYCKHRDKLASIDPAYDVKALPFKEIPYRIFRLVALIIPNHCSNEPRGRGRLSGAYSVNASGVFFFFGILFYSLLSVLNPFSSFVERKTSLVLLLINANSSRVWYPFFSFATLKQSTTIRK